MATATAKNIKEITLILSEEEAKYLKDITQNFTPESTPSKITEPTKAREYREVIYTELTTALIKTYPN